MKIASEEIRSLVVKACISGTASKKQLSLIFGYTIATINNWLRGYRRDERLAPQPRGHRKASFSPEEMKELTTLLNSRPDMTLAEIKEYFGKECSLVAIHKTLMKLGFVFKKNAEGKRARTRGHCPSA